MSPQQMTATGPPRGKATLKVYTLRTFKDVPSGHLSKAARDVSPSKTFLSKKPGNPNNIPMLSGTRPFWSAVDEGHLQTAYYKF